MNSPLPAGWVERPLEAVVDPARPITYGIVLPGADYPGGVPYVRVVDMAEGTVQTVDLRKTSPEIAGKYRRSALVAGDVLLSIRGHVGRIAIVPPGLDGANLTQDTARIAVRDCDPGYVRWALQGLRIQRWMERHKKGASVKGINLADVRKIPIRLPPLPEQRRIAAILDQADAIRRKRREALRLTEEFLRSAFLEMFGDPVTNPKGWPVVRFGTCLTGLEAGWSAKGDQRERQPGEFAVLKISAVTSGRFNPAEIKVVGSLPAGKSLVVPRRGDLLFSRANTRELVGATCLVEQDEPQLFLPDKLWKLVPRSAVACSEYLKFLLWNRRFRARLARFATGTSGSMLNVSQQKLRALKAPLPPVALQSRFGRLVWQAYANDRLLNSAAQAADRLAGALQQRAFRGEL